eukprot:1201548-Amphidinium_carterae.1
MVRVRIKALRPHRPVRANKRANMWKNQLFIQNLTASLPDVLPTDMGEWQNMILGGVEKAKRLTGRAFHADTSHWDERACQLKRERDGSHGVQRRVLSKELYLHLKRAKAGKKVDECKKGGNLFKLFVKKHGRRTLLVDEGGKRIATDIALDQMTNYLGQKVNAISRDDWNGSFQTFPIDSTYKFDEQVKLGPKDLRRRVGKGIGPDGMHPIVIKHLPDQWLQVVRSCLDRSLSGEQFLLSDWNLQKLRPLPKKNCSKLCLTDFRGIAVSNVARDLASSVMLEALA